MEPSSPDSKNTLPSALPAVDHEEEPELPLDPIQEAENSSTAPLPMPISKFPPSLKEGWLALGSALVYLVFWQIVLRIPLSDIVTIATTTLLSLFLALLFTVRMARAACSPLALGMNLALSVLLILPTVLPLLLPVSVTSGLLRGILSIYSKIFHAVPGLHGLLLMWFAASLGTGISRLVKEMKLLLPMAVVLALVDLYVVFGGGLVTQAKSGSAVAQKAMTMLTVPLPTVPQPRVAAPIQLAVGVADFLFIALFFACFVRFQIPARKTFLVLCGTLAVYMMIVFFRAIDLPALVPIAVVVIGMNFRRFRYERSEAFALLYAGLICMALAAGLYLYSKQLKPPAEAQQAAPLQTQRRGEGKE